MSYAAHAGARRSRCLRRLGRPRAEKLSGYLFIYIMLIIDVFRLQIFLFSDLHFRIGHPFLGGLKGGGAGRQRGGSSAIATPLLFMYLCIRHVPGSKQPWGTFLLICVFGNLSLTSGNHPDKSRTVVFVCQHSLLSSFNIENVFVPAKYS